MCPASLGTSRALALEAGEAKLWAILVGVNQYADERLPALAYSALDCQGLGEAISAATGGFPQKTLLVHHDFAGAKPEAGQPRSLAKQVAVSGRLGLGTIAKLRGFQAQPPQRTSVETSLQQVLESAQPQDTVLFYFSGHGVLDLETQQAVLCLSDTDRDNLSQTGLNIRSLLNRLNNCRAHQQIVWLDACHSGGLSLRGSENPTPQLVEVLQQQAARSQGFYALLSCDQNQLSWEFPELGHGVFTYYLMRGLLGEAADAQGVIEADALYKYVYYQTLRYIDKTNQQLRLINQQKRGRGESQLQPEYPLQTPKRIVEGIGELIIGAKPELAAPRHPRQALVVEGLISSPITIAISKLLRTEGGFELRYLPQPGQAETDLRAAIRACLQSEETASALTESATVLLYLRGQLKVTASGDACLGLRHQAEISRSWLRQALRQSPIARQVVILDCPNGENFQDWLEDLQIPGRGQCLIAVSSPVTDPDWFAQTLLDTLNLAEPQAGLSSAGWIAQIQARAAEAGVMPQIWLSGSQGVIEVLPGLGMRGRAVEEFDLGVCPYLGLRAFSEEDAPFFYGREALTQRLIQMAMQQPFLAVLGASGSGKSSVVQAGLMAALRQGKQIPGSETWWLGICRPSSRPLAALAESLAAHDTERWQLEGMLYQGVESFVYWLRSRPEPMLLLVIDQFEELFTLASEADRQQVLDLLLGAVDHAGDRFRLVITLRSDFVAAGLEYPRLAERLQQSSLLVPPGLSEADYRQIILRPAEQVGLSVDPELVEVLLQALNQSAGDLPLLEFVLEQLWENRQPGTLTLQVYQQKIGGLKGALERRAQELYDSLDPEAQACARWIFLALTQLGEGTEDTRRRVSKADLVVPKFPAALVDRTLQGLVAAKLVVVTADQALEVGPEAAKLPLVPLVTVEVAHEILIRHWSTLRWWLEENRSRLRSQRQIEQAARQWQQSGQIADFLLTGVRLDAAEELYVKYTDELSPDVQMFIEAGLAERQREQQQTKRRLRQTQAAAGLIGSLGLAAAGFGGFAYMQQQTARLNEISTLNALSESQLLADRQIEALMTGLQAGQQIQQILGLGLNAEHLAEVKLQTVATVQQAVAQTQESNRLEGHSQRVTSVAVTAAQIASGSEDGTVKIWATDGRLIRTLKAGERVTAVAYAGERLAAATAKGAIIFWDAAGQKQQTLQAGNWVTSLAVSADGQALATGSRDQTVKLWSVATGKLLKSWTAHSGFVNTVAFSPDKLVASAGEDGLIKLWDLQGKLVKTLTGHKGRVSHLDFSAAGALVSGGEDGVIRLWDWRTAKLTLLGEHSQPVNWVQLSPDGQRVLSASNDRSLKLWQTDGMLIGTFKGHGEAVLSAAFGSNDQIVSSSADKTVRLWDTQGLQAPVGKARVVQFSPIENSFVAAGWDGKIEIWQDDRLRKSWKGHSAAVTAVSFGANGQLASASEDKTLKLWDAQGQLLKSFDPASPIAALSFSPDGKLLANSSTNAIQIRQSDGQPIRSLSGHQDSVSALAWSPNSQLLASGSYDNAVKLWRPDGQLIKTLTGHSSAIAALAFSPNGQTLASASWDNSIKLWRVSDGQLLHSLTGHQDGVTSLAFSPDGQTLASGSADQHLKLWNTDSGSLLKTLLGQPDTLLSLSFSPNGQRLIAAGESRSFQTWDLNLPELVQQGCERLHDYLAHHPTEAICQPHS